MGIAHSPGGDATIADALANIDGIIICVIALNAHFDGKVLVPDEPLELPANQRVRIELEPIDAAQAEPKPKRVFGLQAGAVTYLAPDWADPLPDDTWDHNRDEQIKP